MAIRQLKEPGWLRSALSEMGGRSWLLVTCFVFLSLAVSTFLFHYEETFTPEHWLSTLKWCVYAIALIVGKRVAEEVGAAFGKNGCE